MNSMVASHLPRLLASAVRTPGELKKAEGHLVNAREKQPPS